MSSSAAPPSFSPLWVPPAQSQPASTSAAAPVLALWLEDISQQTPLAVPLPSAFSQEPPCHSGSSHPLPALFITPQVLPCPLNWPNFSVEPTLGEIFVLLHPQRFGEAHQALASL